MNAAEKISLAKTSTTHARRVLLVLDRLAHVGCWRGLGQSDLFRLRGEVQVISDAIRYRAEAGQAPHHRTMVRLESVKVMAGSILGRDKAGAAGAILDTLLTGEDPWPIMSNYRGR